MSILGFDGFEGIVTGDLPMRGWAFGSEGSGLAFGYANVVSGGLNGQGFESQSPYGSSTPRSRFIQRSVTATTGEFIVGFTARTVGDPGMDVGFFQLIGGGSIHLTLVRTTDGAVVVKRGDVNGTVLASTITTFFPVDAWRYFEMRVLIADSGGYVYLKADGSPTFPIIFTGDTRNGGSAQVDAIRMTCSTYTELRTMRFDDLYWMDTNAPGATEPLGPVRIQALLPTSDAAVQFTKSTGATNYGTVDEALPNGDTDYNESSTAGHSDRFGFSDIVGPASVVHAVQTRVRARRTDAGAVTLVPLINSNGANEDGATEALAASFSEYTDLHYQNPDGSVPWSAAAVNALTAGYKIPA